MNEPRRGRAPRRRAGAAVLVTSLLLGACAATAPRETGFGAIDVPAAWSEADAGAPAVTSSAGAVPARWRLRFDDALLNRLIDEALRHNTSILSAEGSLRQARALRDVAAAAFGPTLSGSASAQHGTSGGKSTGNSFAAGVDAAWEPDIFGANRAALDSSDASLRASVANLGDVQVSIAAEVALSYITLRSSQARLDIAVSNLASQQETLQITQWRLQAGLVTSLEAEQARASAEQTGALVPALRTTIVQTRHALAVLTGQPPASLTVLLAGTMPMPVPVPAAQATATLAIPAETLRQRPDVRAAEYRVAAALANVAQADAARLPTFNLSGSLGLNATTLGGLGSGAAVVSSLLGSTALTLFDGGAARAQVRAQQGALDQARASWQAAILTALQEVEDALVAQRGDRERVQHLQQAAEAAANAALLARQRYGSGLVDFQTVLDTQRTQLSAEDSVASASADLGADHVRLFKALGGGWIDNTADDNALSNNVGTSSVGTSSVGTSSVINNSLTQRANRTPNS